QVLVEAEGARDRARNLRHFETVGQPRAVVIALVIDEDLRLVGQPAERGRMNDAVAVALERRADRMLGLAMEPPARLLGLRSVRCQTGPPSHPAILCPAAAAVHPALDNRSAGYVPAVGFAVVAKVMTRPSLRVSVTATT